MYPNIRLLTGFSTHPEQNIFGRYSCRFSQAFGLLVPLNSWAGEKYTLPGISLLPKNADFTFSI
ncbi:MAG: hypothetical protein AVDCRST_MAG95-3037 [uncultured Adhaeribacter sp.]|uniref:Uncharacterized protein n=1 Tax=uncultured Adhaeribacter sp. TaxID=448109 RepID=A0A6J4JFM2_9BACT|nr:MAG: hypothetical protein AVDCRST_MAG95-3037 [uncultured Adhaeribacter sp.]